MSAGLSILRDSIPVHVRRWIYLTYLALWALALLVGVFIAGAGWESPALLVQIGAGLGALGGPLALLAGSNSLDAEEHVEPVDKPADEGPKHLAE